MSYDIVIVGGFGHVGLPLGLVFASKGLRVCLYDTDASKLDSISRGEMPFIEYGAEPILKKVLRDGNLTLSIDAKDIAKAKHVIIAIGTPIDEYLNPQVRLFLEAISAVKKHFNTGQALIVRSTVYPRTIEQLHRHLGTDRPWKIAYCPERIIQGYSIKELGELPQIVAGITPEAGDMAAELFSKIAPRIIRTSLGEAELIKLFANSWRYIQFGVTNQFYMIATQFGLDYDKLRAALIDGYGRAATLPSAGFSAGPCLLKDTMQLAAYSSNNFLLGHSAMMINEGLPNFVVEQLRKRHELSQKKVGILGMAFKADIDDIRDSLSFKLRKILRFHGAEVLCADEFANCWDLVDKEEIFEKCDIVIVGVPHSAYRGLKIPSRVEVVDIWGILNRDG